MCNHVCNMSLSPIYEIIIKCSKNMGKKKIFTEKTDLKLLFKTSSKLFKLVLKAFTYRKI